MANTDDMKMAGRKADLERMGPAIEQMLRFPKIVNVEVYRSACPCQCVHCPVGLTEPADRPARFGENSIDLGLYGRIIDEIAEHPGSSVRIHSVGEPLLWDDLAIAVEYAHDREVPSWIFTSALTSDRKLLEALCDNVSIIEVSVNSVDRADYKATKGVDAFGVVELNIAHMSAYIKENSLPTRLIASRVQTESEEQDREFVEHWKGSGLVSDAFVRTYHTYNKLLGEHEAPGCQHEPCLVHWGRFNISSYGQAVVCFNELFKQELDPNLILGDLHSQTIEGIWHGYAMDTLRAAELSGDYSLVPGALPCVTCTSCQPLFGNRQTSEYQLSQLGGK